MLVVEKTKACRTGHGQSSKVKWANMAGGMTALGAILCLGLGVDANAAPSNFSEAKRLMRQHVYVDQSTSAEGSFYCGCSWNWHGKSGGSINTTSCGFQTITHRDRANRLEWEHVAPISTVANTRQCWREGGRENCQKTDPVFNKMEADMHNLVVSIGSVNALRSNLNYGAVAGSAMNLGQCSTKIGTGDKVVEPRDEVKGQAARITFYMADRYNVRLSERVQKTLMAWDKQHPVTLWEAERNRRIAYSMGHENPFVNGERKWALGYKPTGDGIKGNSAQQHAKAPAAQTALNTATVNARIHGNKNSGVYHLPQGCPSYNAMSPKNLVVFENESEAKAAGFRKAGNCS